MGDEQYEEPTEGMTLEDALDVQLTPMARLGEDARTADLRIWWEGVSREDFEQMAPKVGEYTSADLEVMGTVMEQWGIAAPEKGAGMEAACVWYLLGKVARAVAAYREGRAPSEDTLHDITVYSMMARRIRETGEWP